MGRKIRYTGPETEPFEATAGSWSATIDPAKINDVYPPLARRLLEQEDYEAATYAEWQAQEGA